MSWGMKKSRTANICDDWCVLIEEDIIWLTFKTNIKHIPFSESGSGPPMFWVYKEAFFPPSLCYTRRKLSLLQAVTIPIMRTQQTFTGPLLEQRGSELDSTAEMMDNDDGEKSKSCLKEAGLTQAKFFLRKLMSPLVEESWEWTSAASLSSDSIFLASCLPSSTLVMQQWRQAEETEVVQRGQRSIQQ